MSLITKMNRNKKIFNNILEINKFIKKTHCKKIEYELSDSYLVKLYRRSPSSQKKIKTLKENLKKLKVRQTDISRIINNDAVLNEFCTPPGTKGVIRGNQFNRIIKEKLTDIIGNSIHQHDLDLQFEKKIGSSPEIPDWYIKQISTNKVLVGMNQIDLWSGGQQTNRGSKYILNEDFHKDESFKVISVVSKFIELESTKNKAYNILKKGFEENRLCYIGNLENIIKEYFKF